MKNFKKNSLLTGTLAVGALITTTNTHAANILNFGYLGTGGQLRTQLLSNSTVSLINNATTDALKSIEGACGEKKAETKTKDAKCGEAKTKDAKCGEAKAKDAKCGEAKAKDAKCGEAKAKDAKCGEAKAKDAKCGEAKAKDAKCGEAKAKDAKCGEAKAKSTKSSNKK